MNSGALCIFEKGSYASNFFVKKIILIIAIISIGTPAFSATYYMATTGSNSNAGTSTAPWLTLVYSLNHISAGDTLIIKNGTYTGAANAIGDVTANPPKSISLWTTIKAENDGGVIFDGENTRRMFYTYNGGATANCHWQFEGIIWCKAPAGESNVLLYWSSYVKFLRCGAYDAGSGNAANFAVGRNGSYILVEGCYAYGSGRYKFMGYQGDYIIFRNCVGRSDIIAAGTEPCAVFSIYSCDYSLVQNCIAIDSDQTAYYSAANYQGPFFVPSTDMNANYVDFKNCIGLNVNLGGIQTAGNSGYRSNYITFNNCVIWNCKPYSTSAPYGNWIRGYNNTLNHCTFGYVNMTGCSTDYIHSYDTDGVNNNTTLTNSLAWGIAGTGRNMLNDVEIQNYNAYYGNTITLNNSGVQDKTTLNFKWSSSNTNGGLKYLPRIENGSNISGLASDGGDIGANVKNLIGTPGTLYGETGYNTNTGVSMWPFPNEALIKTKMADYSNGGVSGARGFCTGTSIDGTAQTLTKYIWEYLGNEIPSDIYGTSASVNKVTGVTVKVID